MLLPKIKSQQQKGDRFCTIYALTNALQIKTGGFISVWRVIISCFRYKGWPFLLNRSFNYREAFAAVHEYGVTVKRPDGSRTQVFPKQLLPVTKDNLDNLLGSEPILAIQAGNHAVVLTGNLGDWYEVLDSQSEAGYIQRHKEIFISPFYIIVL